MICLYATHLFSIIKCSQPARNGCPYISMTTHDDKQDTSLKISQYVHLYIKTYQVLKDDVIMFFSTFSYKPTNPAYFIHSSRWILYCKARYIKSRFKDKTVSGKWNISFCCSVFGSAFLTLLQSKCSYGFRYWHCFRDRTIYIGSDFTVFTLHICI